MIKILLKFFLVIIILNNFDLSLAAPATFRHLQDLPDYLKAFQCRENDSKLNECLRKSLQYVVEQFRSGISDVSLPVLDPVKIRKIINNFSNHLLMGKVTLSNIEINGLANLQLEKINHQKLMDDKRAIRVEADGFIPKLFVKGKHQANAAWSRAKITSNGTFDLVLADIKFNVKFDTELYEKNNHTYMKAYQIDVEPTVGNMTLKADGIFKDSLLNDAMVDFINENWPEFYKLLVTGSRGSWEPAIINTANNYFSYIPYDLLITKE